MKFHDIAYTIFLQLQTLGCIKIWSWGAHAFRAIESGLEFKVQGHHFKGSVRIIYDEGNDLYNISFGHFNRGSWQEKKCYEGVYFDQMVDFIDQEIEYIPDYKSN